MGVLGVAAAVVMVLLGIGMPLSVYLVVTSDQGRRQFWDSLHRRGDAPWWLKWAWTHRGVAVATSLALWVIALAIDWPESRIMLVSSLWFMVALLIVFWKTLPIMKLHYLSAVARAAVRGAGASVTPGVVPRLGW